MKQHNLLEGSISRHMLRLALPSIAGMFSFTIYNLTDTYFVSQLGTNALAAMGFTFPVVMVVGAISGGISMGAASLLSRAKGAGDHHLMQRIATDGIFLSLVFVAAISLVGLLTMNEVFSALGAARDTLPLVKDYMTIWYACVVVVVMPPVCDASMRASGDMMRPFIVMMICAVFNIVLDPLLIHGLWIFPRMGIQGAALATIISRAFGMVATLSFAHFHHRLLSLKASGLREVLASWKGILHIGVPSITVLLMPQLLRSVLTALVAAAGGTLAVAAVAVGTRVESFVTVVTAGVGLAIAPIIGQNWGARQFKRVHRTRDLAIRFAVVYGLAMFALSIPLAKPVSHIFTADAQVAQYSAVYLWIMIFGMIGLSVTNWMSRAFTTIGRPRYTVLLNVGGTLVLVIPLAILGRAVYGYIGILAGVCLGQMIVGAAAVVLAGRKMHPEERKTRVQET